jgi:hypothetical protein
VGAHDDERRRARLGLLGSRSVGDDVLRFQAAIEGELLQFGFVAGGGEILLNHLSGDLLFLRARHPRGEGELLDVRVGFAPHFVGHQELGHQGLGREGHRRKGESHDRHQDEQEQQYSTCVAHGCTSRNRKVTCRFHVSFSFQG